MRKDVQKILLIFNFVYSFCTEYFRQLFRIICFQSVKKRKHRKNERFIKKILWLSAYWTLNLNQIIIVPHDERYGRIGKKEVNEGGQHERKKMYKRRRKQEVKPLVFNVGYVWSVHKIYVMSSMTSDEDCDELLQYCI